MLLNALELDATERCNLACSFCYGRRSDRDMSDEVAQAAVELLRQHINPTCRFPYIHWIGSGEPMLRWPWLLDMSRWAKSQFAGRAGLTLTTNMTIMPKGFLQAWRRELKGRLVASIDGPPDVQRRLRGSDPVVVERNASRAITFGHTRVRSTVTPDSVAMLKEGVEYLYRLGFRHITQTPAYEPEWTDEALDTYAEQMQVVGEWFVQRVRRGEHVRLTAIDLGMRVSPSEVDGPPKPCRAGHTRIACDVRGILYPCHRYCGGTRRQLGTVGHGVDLAALQRSRACTEHAENMAPGRTPSAPTCHWLRETAAAPAQVRFHARYLRIMADAAQRVKQSLGEHGMADAFGCRDCSFHSGAD